MFSKSFVPVDMVWLTLEQPAPHQPDIALSGIFHLRRQRAKRICLHIHLATAATTIVMEVTAYERNSHLGKEQS